VNFGDSLIFNITKVDRAIALGQAVLHEPMNLEMLERIAKKQLAIPPFQEMSRRL
jgi:hypothetical protein